MKVAIYARYSSDIQRDASIADQLRVCREYADREGWQVVPEYEDHAVSGATVLRPGVQALMAMALKRECDIVLAEALAVHEQIRVIDESGEDYLYPARRFAEIDLPSSLRRAVAAAV